MELSASIKRLQTMHVFSKAIIVTCLAASLALHLTAAMFSKGNIHPDGHFQILEFANYKLGHTPEADMPWEFATRIRPALQPAIVYSTHRALDAIGQSTPFKVTFVLRLLSALVGMAAALLLCFYSFRWFTGDRFKLALFLVTCFLWAFPFLHARFTAESWSASFLCTGIWMLLIATDQRSAGRSIGYAALAGLILGFAFYFRFPIGFALLGIALWLMLHHRPAPAGIIVSGCIGFGCAVMVNMTIDHWFYGRWVLTPYNYFVVNILQDTAASFGVDPWWFYIERLLIVLIPPFSPLLLGVLLFACLRHRGNLLVWVLLAFILGHSVVGHKETRFLIPIVPLLPILILLGFEELRAMLPERVESRAVSTAVRIGLYFLVTINFVLLIPAVVLPVHKYAFIHEWLYHHGNGKEFDLYTYGVDPYDYDQLTMHYYQTPTVKVRRIVSNNELCKRISTTAKPVYVLIVSAQERRELPQSCARLHLESSRYPSWVWWFDDYGWLRDLHTPAVFRLSGR